MSYSEKLKMPQWQKRRLEIFQRDNFSCTHCGNDKEELQVHHRIYIAGIHPWDYPDDVLVTLCKTCHDKEYVRYKHEFYLLHTLKASGFTAMEILSMSCFIEKYSGFRNELKQLIHKSIEAGL